ncbi:hypothetical protein IMY05_C4839000200 [Salix suchowensis]|nr:hypothetical protein IMY05_C4839000200 [Salix suchowensis]
MRAAAAAATGQHQQSSTTSPHGHGSRHGHHSYQPDVLSAGPASAGVVSPNNRHRERSEHHRERTQPEYLYETSLDQSYASTASPGMPTPPTSAPAVSGSTAASAGRKGFVPSPVAVPMDEDDPFSMPVGPKSAGVVANNAPAERERRPSMDGTQLPAAVASPLSRKSLQRARRRNPRMASGIQSRLSTMNPRAAEGVMTVLLQDGAKTRRRREGRKERIGIAEPPITTSTAKRNGETPVPAVGERTPTKAKSNNGPNTLSMPTPVVNVKAASPPGTPIAFSPTAKDRDDTSMDIDDAKGPGRSPAVRTNQKLARSTPEVVVIGEVCPPSAWARYSVAHPVLPTSAYHQKDLTLWTEWQSTAKYPTTAFGRGE